MQWLIDIILELAREQIGFFNRGDPGAADHTKLTLTLDNGWHDWDMSAIVPANARLVLLRTFVKSTVANKRIQFRTKGNVGWPNLAISRAQFANINWERDCQVAVDSDRVIQYKASVAPWTDCNITIAGWWLR